MKRMELAALSETLSELKKQGKRVVHCHGVFDLLHIGHIRYFEEAATMGDVLVVTVTPDRFVDKGPFRPAFPEDLRAEAVASLEMVDYVAINDWSTAEETLRQIGRAHV
jgi:cytidyltransferase-like protein